MRVLLLGATGFIGSSVAARLSGEGHEVIAVSRTSGASARRVAVARMVQLDVRGAVEPQDWLPYLSGVDAVVNCIGVLQDNGRDCTEAVHTAVPAALWDACARAGVSRIIHFSAMGVDRGALSRFSATKFDGDRALMDHSDLDWVILRPFVVVGRPAYGGSALFRALAASPVLPAVSDAGPLDIVQLDDVVETVVRMLRPGAASKVCLELAGPERLSFEEVVAAYRNWLGWEPARILRLPGLLTAVAYRLGDLIAILGWRPPVRTTARREMTRGAIGDAAAWREATGIEPRELAAALASSPASAQDRWFASLYLLKPLLFGTFAFFWLLTGIVSLTSGHAHAEQLMRDAGAGPLSGVSVVAGGLADIVVGLAILVRRTSRLALLAALALSFFYVVAGTLLHPELWSDPLGPMMKIWPILAFNLVCLAILEER